MRQPIKPSSSLRGGQASNMTSKQYDTTPSFDVFARDWFSELVRILHHPTSTLLETGVVTLSTIWHYGDEKLNFNQTAHLLRMAYKKARSARGILTFPQHRIHSIHLINAGPLFISTTNTFFCYTRS